MQVDKAKHRKYLTEEEWEWLTQGPGIFKFLQNKLELILTKQHPSSSKYGPGVNAQLGLPKLIQFTEEQCEGIFYIDKVESYEQIHLRIYFSKRNDLTKCKMTLPPAIENNEFI